MTPDLKLCLKPSNVKRPNTPGRGCSNRFPLMKVRLAVFVEKKIYLEFLGRLQTSKEIIFGI